LIIQRFKYIIIIFQGKKSGLIPVPDDANFQNVHPLFLAV